MSFLQKIIKPSILIGCIFYQIQVHPSFDQIILTPNQINEDLDQFQTELEERFAYLKTNNAYYKTAIQSIREKTTKGMEVNVFGIALTKVLGLFQECHAGIGGLRYPEGYLPFFIESIGDRYIAVLSDRSNFLDDDFP